MNNIFINLAERNRIENSKMFVFRDYLMILFLTDDLIAIEKFCNIKKVYAKSVESCSNKNVAAVIIGRVFLFAFVLKMDGLKNKTAALVATKRSINFFTHFDNCQMTLHLYYKLLDGENASKIPCSQHAKTDSVS